MLNETEHDIIGYDEIIAEFTATEKEQTYNDFKQLQAKGIINKEVSFEEYILAGTRLGVNALLGKEFINTTIQQLKDYREATLAAYTLLKSSEAKIDYELLHYDHAINALERLLQHLSRG